jgi:hypothetical protein
MFQTLLNHTTVTAWTRFVHFKVAFLSTKAIALSSFERKFS